MINNQTKHHLILTGIASGCATILSKFIIYPIESIKTKVQVSRTMKVLEPGLAMRLINKTYRNQGIKGFYRGAMLATLGSAPACALYYITYEFFKLFLSKFEVFQKNIPSIKFFVSGFMAQLFSCVMWVPLDVIKERMQAQSQMNYKYKSSSQAFKTIINYEGIKKGLYRAYGGTLCYFGPFSALYFTTYQQLKKYFLQVGQKPVFLKSALMAGTSGIFSGILCNPMDLAKIRMQVDKKLLNNQSFESKPMFGYNNVFDGMIKIVKNQGFFGLYKGSLIRIWTTGPITALIMGFTESFRTHLKTQFPYKNQ